MKTIRTKTDLAWLMAQADTQQVDSMQTVLLMGRPGSRKTMVARRMAARVREPEGYDAVEVAWLHYGAGLVAPLTGPDGPDPTTWQQAGCAPFRAPHHTCSTAAIVGGGPKGRPRPGEASLAHRGTLFLDELPEFRRCTVRDLGGVLRRGGESFQIDDTAVKLPARPRLLIAAATPCPCGYHGTARCTCSATAVQSHQARTREYAELLGIAVYVQLDLDPDARERLTEYPVPTPAEWRLEP